MIQRLLGSPAAGGPSGSAPHQNERFLGIYWQIRLYAKLLLRVDPPGSLLRGSVGLGLWISRSLSRAMGGELICYRRLGWTCFELRLPRAQLAAPAIGLELSSRE